MASRFTQSILHHRTTLRSLLRRPRPLPPPAKISNRLSPSTTTTTTNLLEPKLTSSFLQRAPYSSRPDWELRVIVTGVFGDIEEICRGLTSLLNRMLTVTESTADMISRLLDVVEKLKEENERLRAQFRIAVSLGVVNLFLSPLMIYFLLE